MTDSMFIQMERKTLVNYLKSRYNSVFMEQFLTLNTCKDQMWYNRDTDLLNP